MRIAVILPPGVSVPRAVWVPLPFPGAEEHHVVLREVTDGDLPRQFAHPGGHPHHPVQHDPDEGRLPHQ